MRTTSWSPIFQRLLLAHKKVLRGIAKVKEGDGMKKIAAFLLVVLNLTFFPSSASAQNKPLACQVDEAAGLKWERGRWTTKKFIIEKFILVQTGSTLELMSVARTFHPSMPYPGGVFCKTYVDGEIMCNDLGGGSLFFDLKTLKGGISRLAGSVSNDAADRDTVTVEVFSCTPF